VAASRALLTTALIHAARSRAATSCLKKREETFVVFRRELISPDSTFVGQGIVFAHYMGVGVGSLDRSVRTQAGGSVWVLRTIRRRSCVQRGIGGLNLGVCTTWL